MSEHNLKIDKEFKVLIPPLDSDEYKQLEENIINDGCRDPLIVWNDTILDGHNRYKICREHDIDFDVKEMAFFDRRDAIVWIIKNQFGRRNIGPQVRARLAYQMKEIIAAQAKENMVKGGSVTKEGFQNSGNLVPPVTTDKELAKIAGVSHDTIHKMGTIIRNGSDELNAAVDAGDVSVNAAYEIARLDKEEQVTLIEEGADAMRKAAKEIKETRKAAKTEVPQVREGYSDGLTYAHMAVRQLERIHPKDRYREEAFEYAITWCLDNGFNAEQRLAFLKKAIADIEQGGGVPC